MPLFYTLEPKLACSIIKKVFENTTSNLAHINTELLPVGEFVLEVTEPIFWVKVEIKDKTKVTASHETELKAENKIKITGVWLHNLLSNIESFSLAMRKKAMSFSGPQKDILKQVIKNNIRPLILAYNSVIAKGI